MYQGTTHHKSDTYTLIEIQQDCQDNYRVLYIFIYGYWVVLVHSA